MATRPTLVRRRQPEFEAIAVDRDSRNVLVVAKGLDGLSADEIEDRAHEFMRPFFEDPAEGRGLAEAGIWPVETGIAPADFRLGSDLVRKGDWFLKLRVADAATWTDLTREEKTTVTKTTSEPAKPRRSAAESLAELERVEKRFERWEDSHAEEKIEAAAERIRKASNYTLSKPEAVAKALEQDPELYAGYRRHLMRRQGVIDDSPATLRKAAEAQTALERAGERVRREHPELTKEQAVAKALELDPSLY